MNRIFANLTGGDYPGHSSGDHVSRASWLRSRWTSVNYDCFFDDGIQNHHPIVKGRRESKSLRKLCMLTGQVINMHKDFLELPNMYLELGVDPTILDSKSSDNFIMKRIQKYKDFQSGRFIK